ncbi:MAG: hypothetical protein QG604_106 [Candidatus Dependentiae bacterium]|nr:hypothetical protein [Candidatus Dependentiae bacterium]
MHITIILLTTCMATSLLPTDKLAVHTDIAEAEAQIPAVLTQVAEVDGYIGDITDLLKKQAIEEAVDAHRRQNLIPRKSWSVPLRRRLNLPRTPQVDGEKSFVVKIPPEQIPQASYAPATRNLYMVMPQEVTLDNTATTYEPFSPLTEAQQKNRALIAKTATLYKRVPKKLCEQSWYGRQKSLDTIFLIPDQEHGDYIRNDTVFKVTPAVFSQLHDTNGGEPELDKNPRFFKRSDGAMIPCGQHDLALGIYEGFGRQVGLLGAETVATALFYQSFKKARDASVVDTLLANAEAICTDKQWAKNLGKKLCFMPLNPFNKKSLPYVGLYATMSELVRLAERNLVGPTFMNGAITKAQDFFDTFMKKGSNAFREDLHWEYATGVPIPLYGILEFVSTGKLSVLEDGSAVILGGQPSTQQEQVIDFARRFLIAFFTLRFTDSSAIQKLISLARKNEKGFFALLRSGNKQEIEKFVESAGLTHGSLLSLFLKGPLKPLGSKLHGAQIIYWQRLKASLLVNALFSLPVIIKFVYGMGRFIAEAKKPY